MVGLVHGLVFGLVSGLFALGWGLLVGYGLVFGLVFGLFGLVVGLVSGFGPASGLAVMEAMRLWRVRFMPLLQNALHTQVLRQAGAVYQFRHAALQDLLAAHNSSTRATEPQSTS